MTEKQAKRLLTLFGAGFLLVFCAGPFLFMAVTSLSRQPDFLARTEGLRLTLQNYRDVLFDPSLHFMDYLKNSLLVSFISAFGSVAIAALAAYGVTKIRFQGSRLLLLLILAASMFPQISLMPYLFKFMTGLGWINTYGALVLPYIAWILPLTVWILVSYFAQIPDDLDQAAMIDGCSRWQALVFVLLPVAAPGIFSAAILAFIFAFNEFLFALMLTSDYHARTVPVGIALFQGSHGQLPWGQIMAACMVTTFPVLGLAVFFQKRIVRGLTQGAVKE